MTEKEKRFLIKLIEDYGATKTKLAEYKLLNEVEGANNIAELINSLSEHKDWLMSCIVDIIKKL